MLVTETERITKVCNDWEEKLLANAHLINEEIQVKINNLILEITLLVVDRHKLTVFYLKSFDMDSVQVGKAVFVKEIYTTLGIEPRTYS